MEIHFQIKSDIQIPDHLYNEAAELFLNHLERFYEVQLSKGDNSLLISQESTQKKNTQRIHLVQLKHLGQTCPLYYKRRKGHDNVAQPCQNQI